MPFQGVVVDGAPLELTGDMFCSVSPPWTLPGGRSRTIAASGTFIGARYRLTPSWRPRATPATSCALSRTSVERRPAHRGPYRPVADGSESITWPTWNLA